MHQPGPAQQDALGRPGRPARAQEDPAPAAARGRSWTGARQPGHGDLASRGSPTPGRRRRPRAAAPLLAPALRRRPGGAGIKRDRHPARRRGCRPGRRRSRTHPAAGPPPGRRGVSGPRSRFLAQASHGVLQPGVGQRRGAGPRPPDKGRRPGWRPPRRSALLAQSGSVLIGRRARQRGAHGRNHRTSGLGRRASPGRHGSGRRPPARNPLRQQGPPGLLLASGQRHRQRRPGQQGG